MGTILAADVGGTFARLALYPEPDRLEGVGKDGGGRDITVLGEPITQRSYRSADFPSFSKILELFLEQSGCRDGLAAACFAIAGPADRELVQVTNLSWKINRAELMDVLGCERVTFLNDFEAICYAVPHLGEDCLRPLGGGDPELRGPIAVLGPGTGLGQAFLVWSGVGYQAVPSEGGHADFAPRGAEQLRLLENLTGRFGRVSWERVLSGPGLVNIHDFLREAPIGATNDPERASMVGELDAGDPAAAISRQGLDGSDPLCVRALEMFCAIYGAEAGNMALKILATGGVYLAGGVTRKILPALEAGGFRHAFEDKGRYRDMLRGVPVFAITHPEPGLLGAALAALKQ